MFQENEEYIRKIEYYYSKKDKAQWMKDFVSNQEGFSKIQAMFLVLSLTELDYESDMIFYLESHLNHHKKLIEKNQVLDVEPIIYFNYVLQKRVNTESLSDMQNYYYSKLQGIMMSNKSIHEKIKDINYWAYGEVRYGPSDGRTRSSQTTFETGTGRCGEQSVFLVDVFRSVGIPARQIYVPWWVHTDDRHAWVEVFDGNRWYYLGACEPEPILNSAWFDDTALQMPLAHTHIFGPIWGMSSEKLVFSNENNNYKSLNVTDNYTQTRCVEIFFDSSIEIIEAQLGVFNYGLFQLLAQKNIKNKKVVWRLAYVDTFLIMKDYEGNKYFKKIKKEDSKVVVDDTSLLSGQKKLWTQRFTQYKPKKSYSSCHRSLLDHYRKLSFYDKKYKAKMQKDSRYQHLELEEKIGTQAAIAMLSSMSSKDKEDMDVSVLIHHYNHQKRWRSYFSKEIFTQYVLPIRIHDENLSLYSDEFDTLFKQENKISAIKEWLNKNFIIVQESSIPWAIRTVQRLYSNRMGTHLERNILAVAMLRSQGVPSRLSDDFSYVEYLDPDRNEFVYFDDVERYEIDVEKTEAARTTVRNLLTMESIELDEDTSKLYLPKGDYLFVSSYRYPNLEQNGSMIYKTINRPTTVDLTFEIEDVEKYLSEIYIRDIFESLHIPHISDGIYLIGEIDSEPMVHFMHELCECSSFYNVFNLSITILSFSKAAKNEELITEMRKKINNFSYIEVSNHGFDKLSRRVYQEPGKYPLLLFLKNSLVAHVHSGYQVGLFRNTWIKNIWEVVE